jgi:hypothetical protein
VPYAALLRAWQGDRGGSDPASAYVRLVEAGLAQPRASPFRGRSAAEPWARRGSSASCGPAPGRCWPNPAASESRALAALDPDVICAAVVDHCGLDRSALLHRHDPHLARAVAAWLRRRHIEATLRELALRLRLSRATSVPNRTRRLEPAWRSVPAWGESGRRSYGK